MKRLEASQSRYFAPLVLNLDGLRKILAVLEAAEDVEITADGICYESVDELAGHLLGKSPQELTITTSHPYFCVELAPSWARLYAGRDDLVSVGMFTRIAEVLSASERSPRGIYKASRVFLLFIGAQALSYVPAFKFMEQAIIVFTILVLAWYLWIQFIQLRKHAFVVTHELKDGRRFFQRNADNITVAIVSAVAGAVVGAATTKLTERILPSTHPATQLSAPAPSKPEG